MIDIEALDASIQAKGQSDPNLAECRGYVFNLGYATGKPAMALKPVDVLIVGMNPGEAPELSEGYSKTSERRWLERCQFFADAAGGTWATTELIFWSSKDLAVLKARIGDIEPYLAWCAEINKALISFHRPKLIFQPGLGWAQYAMSHYALKHKGRYRRDDTSKTLMDCYEMEDGTPWICTPHWTAAFGFSTDDRQKIQTEARRMVATG